MVGLKESNTTTNPLDPCRQLSLIEALIVKHSSLVKYTQCMQGMWPYVSLTNIYKRSSDLSIQSDETGRCYSMQDVQSSTKFNGPKPLIPSYAWCIGLYKLI